MKTHINIIIVCIFLILDYWTSKIVSGVLNESRGAHFKLINYKPMGVKWLLNLLDFGNSGGGLADRGGHIAMVGINTFVLEYFDFDVHTV